MLLINPRFLFVFLLPFFCFSPAYGNPSPDNSLNFLGSLTWYNVGYWAPLTKNDAMLSLLPEKPERWALISDLRPNLKLVHQAIQFIARPRLRINYAAPGPQSVGAPAKVTSTSSMNEAFFQWNLSDHMLFAYGLQSFQWGPAETLSPSNRMFHDVVLLHDILFEIRGRYIGRINYSLGDSLSLVLMTEYQNNPDNGVFQADVPFSTTTLAKGEYSWGGGASYLGLVVGGSDNNKPWLGEYLNLAIPPLEGFSIYWDASHTRGSSAYYPVNVRSPDGKKMGILLEQAEIDSTSIKTSAVMGLRYDFVNGAILRGEYVLNEAGYTQGQRDVVKVGVLANPTPDLIGRALAPGLDLRGQRYAYLSLRYPDFLVRDLVASGYAMYALGDKSSRVYSAFEYSVGKTGTLFVSGTFNRGTGASELPSFSPQAYVGGYRHIW